MTFRIDHHHFFHFEEDHDTTLRKILEVSLNNQNKLQTIMATIADFQAAVQRIDKSTSDIADRMNGLITILKTYQDDAGSVVLPKAQAEQVLAQLLADADKLDGIGKPATIPTTPVEPAPVTDPSTINTGEVTPEVTPVETPTETPVDAPATEVDPSVQA